MLILLVRLMAFRRLQLHPFRTGMCVLGIAVGVALFVSIRTINSSTLTFFRDNIVAIQGKAPLSVLSGEGGFVQDRTEIVKAVPGVRDALPIVEARTRTVARERGDRPATLVVYGVDLMQDTSVLSFESAKERVIDDPLAFVSQPDSILVTRAFAAKHQLRRDSTFVMLTPEGEQSFVVRGFMANEGLASAYGGDVALMDIDAARLAFARKGLVDRVAVVPSEGADLSSLARSIELRLGPGFRVERPATQADTLARVVTAYQHLLSFLGSIALLVGLFVVSNAMALSVADRRREIGLFRAVGASRAALLAMFLVEAFIVGVIGSALGVALGRGLARGLVGYVSKSMSRQYVMPIDVSTLQMGPTTILIGVGSGIVCAILAALAPAWRATHVEALEAIRPKGVEDTGERTGVRAATGWLGLALLAGLFVPQPAEIPAQLAWLASAAPPLFAVVGASLAGPWLVLGTVRWLRSASFARGLAGAAVVRLACDNILRSPKRTKSNVQSLMLGLMLVIGLASIHRSFERSIIDWQNRTLQFDLIVSSVGRVASSEVQPLDEKLAEEISRIPGVDGPVNALRFTHGSYEGRRIGIKAADPTHPRIHSTLFDTVDVPPERAQQLLFRTDVPTVLVSSNFAEHFGKKSGDTIALDTPSGQVSFVIGAQVVDYADPEGTVYLKRDTYKRLWRDTLVTAFGVEAERGVGSSELRDAIERELGDRGIVVMLNEALRAQTAEYLDETFAYTHAIELAALVVCLLGMLNTVIVGLLERTRELGLLRALGMSRRQLSGMVLLENVMVGTLSGCVAVAFGGFIARLWTVQTMAKTLGWQVESHVPFSAAIITLVAGVSVGALAGLWGSFRASAIQIRDALETT